MARETAKKVRLCICTVSGTVPYCARKEALGPEVKLPEVSQRCQSNYLCTTPVVYFLFEISRPASGKEERKKDQDPASEIVLVRVSQVFSEVFKSSRPARLQRSHQIHNFLDSSIDPCVRVHVCSI